MSVTFTTLHGKEKQIEPKDIIVRPAAYAIVIRDGAMLLLKVKTTRRWFFPGGGLHVDERLEAGLAREVQEETGLQVRAESLFATLEHFFYYDPLDEAYHMYMFFYRAEIIAGELKDVPQTGEETKEPQWVPIASLQEKDFDPVYQELVQQIKQL